MNSLTLNSELCWRPWTSFRCFTTYVISPTNYEDFNSRLSKLELTDFISLKFSIIKQIFLFRFFLSWWTPLLSLRLGVVSLRAQTHTHAHHWLSQMHLTNFLQLSPSLVPRPFGVFSLSPKRPGDEASSPHAGFVLGGDGRLYLLLYLWCGEFTHTHTHMIMDSLDTL